MTTPAERFLEQSARYLRDDYVPRIASCLEQLAEDDVWWRPNEASNSIGNLVLHLVGNARQWIVHGVGGAPDVRRRQEEFDRREAIPKAELLERLRATVAEAAAVIGRVAPDQLLQPRVIQSYETTVQGAVYHVVEHFSMHTGQIILLAKARTGRDLGFYVMQDGNPKPAWQPEA
ncbi:MAG TPA: DinB family protein [Gemmatimonadales bacterium]